MAFLKVIDNEHFGLTIITIRPQYDIHVILNSTTNSIIILIVECFQKLESKARVGINLNKVAVYSTRTDNFLISLDKLHFFLRNQFF